VNYQEEIIRYRLERAEETYQEALLMRREKHWNTCANRLYYACFYAVSALRNSTAFHLGSTAVSKRFSISILSRQEYLIRNSGGCTTDCSMPDRKVITLILSNMLPRMLNLG
jgi:hypothetical protein